MFEVPARLWSLSDPAPAVLIAMRTLACEGAGDACARRLLAGQFGRAHLRIFVLVQLLLARLGEGAQHRIRLAPPCSLSLTGDEAACVAALGAAAAGDGASAAAELASLVTDEAIPAVLEAVAALGEALRDAGYPLEARAQPVTVH